MLAGHDALRRDDRQLRRRAERRLRARPVERREDGDVVGRQGRGDRRHARRRRSAPTARSTSPPAAARRDYANAVVALDGSRPDRQGLVLRRRVAVRVRAGRLPVEGKDVVAAANKDGRIYLLDSASLGGADHKTPLARVAAVRRRRPTSRLARWPPGRTLTARAGLPCRRAARRPPPRSSPRPTAPSPPAPSSPSR